MEPRLNLCAGRAPQPGFHNVDIQAFPGIDQVCDLEEPWPWPDASFDSIRAIDAVEHLHSHIHTMNEAWRVLKPGGIFEIIVPSTDGRGAFQDPTHVSFWNLNSFFYYSLHHPDYRALYPDAIKCNYEIDLKEPPADIATKLVYVRARCRKVPLDAQP